MGVSEPADVADERSYLLGNMKTWGQLVDKGNLSRRAPLFNARWPRNPDMRDKFLVSPLLVWIDNDAAG
jgi:hypothetical protein